MSPGTLTASLPAVPSDPDYAISYVSGTLTVTTGSAHNHGQQPEQGLRCGLADPHRQLHGLGQRRYRRQSDLRRQHVADDQHRATRQSHVGSYPITASGAVDTDYAITYVSGTLTISPAALTITAA